jgi:DNA-binding MarR family transcriptional regulator
VTQSSDLLFLLHDVARLLRHESDRRAAACGMTRAQWMLLFWLERRQGLSQKELAEMLEVEPITVVRLVDQLQQRGMVERRSDPHDRRIWRLYLRAAAAPALQELHGERAAIHEMLTHGLDEATLATMKEGLCRMKATLVQECRRRGAGRDLALKSGEGPAPAAAAPAPEAA